MTEDLIKAIMKLMPIPESLVDELPVMHFYENDIIQCREYQRDERWVVNGLLKLKYTVRKLVVNYLFNPLIQLTQDFDDGHEKIERILIGGVARI